MLSESASSVFDVVSAGVDWITATAKGGDAGLRMDRFASRELDSQRASGLKVFPQNRMGFEGSAGPHFFFGRRKDGVMVQVGGPLSDSLLDEIVPLASNVSRLDLQVTCFTQGEVVDLALNGWDRLKTLPPGTGRPRSYSLIIGHPSGQTLYINSRRSDNFGRLYDKGVQSKCGPAGLLWRYEVEFKRAVAKHHSAECHASRQSAVYAGGLVHSWMSLRGVLPAFAPAGVLSSKCGRLQDSSKDVLTWFEQSLSVTVAKAIKQHGPKRVIESLGLQTYLRPNKG